MKNLFVLPSLRLALLPVLFVLLAIGPLSAEVLDEAATKDLVARITEARRGQAMQADFREEKHLTVLKKPVIESGTLAFLPPDKFRREVKGEQGNLTVSDGQILWIYYPAFQEAEKYALDSNRALRESLAALTAGLSLEQVDKNFTIRAEKTSSGYSLELVPRTSALRKAVSSLRLDVSGALTATRLEILSRSGDRTITTFSNERKTALATDSFRFEPPAGVTVSEPLK